MTLGILSYEIEGDCIYTAMEDCYEGHFKVDIEYIHNATCDMSLIIYQDCTNIQMSFDGRILVDDVAIRLPFQNEEIAVEEVAEKSGITVWTHSNLFIQWNFIDELIIGVPITDQNKICGLCKKMKIFYIYDS